MKNYFHIVNEDLSETKVEEPQSPYEFTYADYLKWNFKERIELIRGRIFKMSPAPTRLHQQIAGNIYRPIHKYLEKQKCQCLFAPVDVRLKGKPFKNKKRRDDQITTVVQPDIIMVCDQEKLKDQRFVDGAPEFVVEILSPGNTKTETKYKLDLYEENGVEEYWVVYPEYKQVAVFLLVNDAYGKPVFYEEGDTIKSVVIKGFKIKLNDIFIT